MSVSWPARARRLGARGSLSAIALLLATGGGSLLPDLAAAEGTPPPTVYVERTGHTADRLFLDEWRAEPALLGDPITEEFDAITGFANTGGAELRVQYFENFALGYDPGAAAGEQVAPLDLGAAALASRLENLPAPALERASKRTACTGGDPCVGFAAAGHTLRGPFLEWWEQNDGSWWLGAPLTESFRAADASMVQYFEFGALRKISTAPVSPLPLGRIVAQAQGLNTDPVARPDDVPVFSPELFVASPAEEPEPQDDELAAPVPPEGWVQPAVNVGWVTGTFGPGPQQGSYREIVVSLSQQATFAYEDGTLMMSTSVSTGTGVVPEAETPIGAFQILSKNELQDMEGNINGYYFVPDVPNIMYFDNLGNALHGTYWHSNFGTPMSHGCVNLPLDAAEWMFGWADIGTPVTVVE